MKTVRCTTCKHKYKTRVAKAKLPTHPCPKCGKEGATEA